MVDCQSVLTEMGEKDCIEDFTTIRTMRGYLDSTLAKMQELKLDPPEDNM